MKVKTALTIENGNDVSKSIEKGLAKPFLGIDYSTEKKAKTYANKNRTYTEELFQNGIQVGFVVMN